MFQLPCSIQPELTLMDSTSTSLTEQSTSGTLPSTSFWHRQSPSTLFYAVILQFILTFLTKLVIFRFSVCFKFYNAPICGSIYLLLGCHARLVHYCIHCYCYCQLNPPFMLGVDLTRFNYNSLYKHGQHTFFNQICYDFY